jgi:cytochrome c-type biogenesis protein CcmH/NrfG
MDTGLSDIWAVIAANPAFAAIALAMTGAVTAILIRAGQRGAGTSADTQADMAVYRDQLAEVDRDIAAGRSARRSSAMAIRVASGRSG